MKLSKKLLQKTPKGQVLNERTETKIEIALPAQNTISIQRVMLETHLNNCTTLVLMLEI